MPKQRGGMALWLACQTCNWWIACQVWDEDLLLHWARNLTIIAHYWLIQATDSSLVQNCSQLN